jgi:adenosine/AMP kinase
MKTTIFSLFFSVLLSISICHAGDKPYWVSDKNWIIITNSFGFVINELPVETSVREETKEDSSKEVEISKQGSLSASGYFVIRKNNIWYPISVINKPEVFLLD